MNTCLVPRFWCVQSPPAATTRAVYLPSGANWVDFWTGEPYAGGNALTANAPANILPLYVRAGSIVPFGPVMQYTSEKPADPLNCVFIAVRTANSLSTKTKATIIIMKKARLRPFRSLGTKVKKR